MKQNKGRKNVKRKNELKLLCRQVDGFTESIPPFCTAPGRPKKTKGNAALLRDDRPVKRVMAKRN